MHPPTVPTLDGIAPELLEAILLQTLDGTTQTNQRQLQRLQLVSQKLCVAARRLVFRDIVIDSPSKGKKLLETLMADATLGNSVRSIVIKSAAFTQPATFSDISQDDFLRICTSLQSLDSPFASFAPLRDGRRPRASYPSNLTFVRLGVPFAQSTHHVDVETESDSEDDEGMRPERTVPTEYLTLLAGLPVATKSLKLSGLPDSSLPSSPPLYPMPLTHLTSLSLDFVTVSPLLLDWLASPTTGVALEKLQIWCVKGLKAAEISTFVQKVGGAVKALLFKPKGSKQGSKFGNELVTYLPKLESLTLGDKACDHEIYGALPATIKKLVVSLPMYHQNARLSPIAVEIKNRLHSLEHLELYSQKYFAPSLEISYPPRRSNEATGLRELRLSHITAAPGEIEAFLAEVGSSLFTFATHHISVDPSIILPYCHSLRRLELGVSGYTSASSTTYFDSLALSHLNYLRIHFTSGVGLLHLVETVKDLAQRRLKTLELAGVFPDNLSEGWTSGKAIDALIEGCKEEGVELWVNGRTVETVGGLWSALVGQTA